MGGIRQYYVGKDRSKENRRYSYYFDGPKIGGKRHKIERKGFKTEEAARAALAKAQEEMRLSRSAQIWEPSRMSYSDYLDEWTESVMRKTVRYSSIRQKESHIRRYIKPGLGSYELGAITPIVITRWLRQLQESGLSKSTVKTIYAVVQKSLAYAVVPMDLIRSNPCRDAVFPRFPAGHPKNARQQEWEHEYITADHLAQLLEQWPEGTPEHIPILIGYHLGLRKSETLGLTWDRIDLQAHTVTVDRQRRVRALPEGGSCFVLCAPKTDQSIRVIRMDRALEDALRKERRRQQEQALAAGGDYIVYRQEEMSDPNGDAVIRIAPCRAADPKRGEKTLDFVCRQAGGEMLAYEFADRITSWAADQGWRFDLHSLRHTNATVLLDEGASVKDVQERLGHRNPSTTLDVYRENTRAQQERSAEIMQRAAEALQQSSEKSG